MSDFQLKLLDEVKELRSSHLAHVQKISLLEHDMVCFLLRNASCFYFFGQVPSIMSKNGYLFGASSVLVSLSLWLCLYAFCKTCICIMCNVMRKSLDTRLCCHELGTGTCFFSLNELYRSNQG